MAQPYVGEIRTFAGNFAPAGWLFCEGQLLPISENETLFQLIGTTYGGDGQSTFALPDLRGRVPIHQGNGFVLAETGGVEMVTLTSNQIPSHYHNVIGAAMPVYGANPGSTDDPTGAYPAISPGDKFYSKQRKGMVKDLSIMGGEAAVPDLLSAEGGSQPHENFQPYLCINFIISLFGIFPTPS